MAHPARIDATPPGDPEAARLLAEAREFRDGGNLWWAEALARRARCHEPASVEAAGLQCELLLTLGRAEQALAIAEPFASAGDRAMLVLRARALCDLERWDEADAACRASDDPPAALVGRIRLAGVAAE